MRSTPTITPQKQKPTYTYRRVHQRVYTYGVQGSPTGRAWGSGARTNRKSAQHLTEEAKEHTHVYVHHHVYNWPRCMQPLVFDKIEATLGANESMGQIDQIHKNRERKKRKLKKNNKRQTKKKAKSSACTAPTGARTHDRKSTVVAHTLCLDHSRNVSCLKGENNYALHTAHARVTNGARAPTG